MRQHRTATAYMLGVLVLLAVIVLTTPRSGTHARWSTTGQTVAAAMAMGRVGFEVGGAESSATSTNGSGFGAEHRPPQVFLAGAAGAPVIP